MAVLMRLISLILIVTALMLLGADAVSSLERGGELVVRSLGTVWGIMNQHSLDAFKSWVQNHTPSLAQGETINQAALRYINRLSDHLFVMARTANNGGMGDVLWVPGENW